VALEGSLQIKLHCHQNWVQQVEIDSQRPLQVVRIFHGKTTTQLLQTVPLLYHVCGVAQASAAVAACEQALAIHAGESTRQAREMLVWMETAREHLWRIMIDWADKLEEQKDKAAIAQWQHYLPRLREALFADHKGFFPGARVTVNANEVKFILQGLKQLLEKVVFAMPAEQWLIGMDISALQQWCENTDTVAAKMLQQVARLEQGGKLNADVLSLPPLDEASLHQRLVQADADVFVAQPQWQGEPRETTVLCRQRQRPLVAALLDESGNGVLTRTVARLVELASIPATLERLFRCMFLQPQAPNPVAAEQQSGIGLAQVEAARGRLVHRLELEQGIVQRYQILAPTEWNFHPQGVAAQLLMRLPAQNEAVLKQQADLLINSIDPCVRYQLALH
jgi:coenzyme F420-reducing hydrogenase alpha subunit